MSRSSPYSILSSLWLKAARVWASCQYFHDGSYAATIAEEMRAVLDTLDLSGVGMLAVRADALAFSPTAPASWNFRTCRVRVGFRPSHRSTEQMWTVYSRGNEGLEAGVGIEPS
jgi:hypothetical protein